MIEYYGIRKKVNMKHSKLTFNQESERCLLADHILNLNSSSVAPAIFRYDLGISDRE